MLPDDAHRCFVHLQFARAAELRGWVGTARILSLTEGTDWWKPYGENEIEVLAGPEFQIPKTTAQQYRRVYKCFGLVPEQELEGARPRLLFQACKAVEDGADPREIVSDAKSLSWSSFLAKWNPSKSPIVRSEGSY